MIGGVVMSIPVAHDQNAEQITFWNGPSGQKWVDRQQSQDVVLGPVSDILIDRAKAAAGERVVDIGCGCGATTFSFARQVGSGGHVLGVDVSEPMLTRARELRSAGAPVEFALADATVHAFEPASFDLLASRFGVMFFAQPALSFANMRKALRPGGRVAFACWRTPRDNPWLMLPLQAAYKHVPKMPQMGPEDPGPFSFADEERVRRILAEAGFASIALERHDLALDIATGKGLDVAVKAAIDTGPASRALEGHPSETRALVNDEIRAMLTPYLRDSKVPLGASIWIVTAVNP
jgi:ubiquinone/menaquinone biosynthesis C-methylase UbiE